MTDIFRMTKEEQSDAINETLRSDGWKLLESKINDLELVDTNFLVSSIESKYDELYKGRVQGIREVLEMINQEKEKSK